MFIIREVLSCKPGKVRPLIDKFRTLSRAVVATGRPPIRLLTDVSGEHFWTLIAEVSVENINDFFSLENEVMEDKSVQNAMSGYHELVASGRREIFRVEIGES